jgi:ABC-type lipoprotein export system ATPase subunit
MNVQLIWENVIPVFLQHEVLPSSDVWGQHFVLNQGTNALINAASGKGKSTMLAMLHGVRSIPQGDILCYGRSLKSYSADDWAEHRKQISSMMFQELRLFESLTVEQNLRMPLALYPDHTFEEAARMLGILGLNEFRARPLSTLSYGQRQRVALVRALNRPFQWLLLDEPFSHLDTSNQALCLQLALDTCSHKKATCLLTTLGSNYGGDFHQVLHL